MATVTPLSLTGVAIAWSSWEQQSQTQIDEEIAARYLPVLALRTKRNELSPVSRLPDELLATVFLLYVVQNHISEWAKGESSFSDATRRAPVWVGVSYVCRRWRMVALGCPMLWTYISHVSNAWMTAFLQRSQMSPLRVKIDVTHASGSYRLPPVLDTLLEHLSRIEVLHIRGIPEDGSCIIPRLLSPAPLLQSLYLAVWGSRRSLETLDVSPLPAIFRRTAPKLRSLELSRLQIAWHSLTLSGLTSLRLFSMPHPRNMQQLFAILTKIPQLVNLELADVFPLRSPPFLNPVMDVMLPCLSRLFIAARVSDAVHFLSHVYVPLSTEIRLKCVLQKHDNLSKLLTYVQKRLDSREDERDRSTPRQPIRSMNVDGAPPEAFSVTCSTSDDGYKYRTLTSQERLDFATRRGDEYDWDQDIPLKVDLTDETATPSLTETMVVNIFQHLSLAHLRCLAIHFPDAVNLSVTFWRDLFTLTPELRFIKLRWTPLSSFVTTLAPGHHGRRGENEEPIAHALEEIELEEVFFSTSCPAAARGSETCACDPTIQCLCDALVRRRDAGFRLKRVNIFRCFDVGTDKEVEKLREVGCEVRWDGSGGYMRPRSF